MRNGGNWGFVAYRRCSQVARAEPGMDVVWEIQYESSGYRAEERFLVANRTCSQADGYWARLL